MRAVLAALVLCLSTQALADVVIKSGASADQATVGATSKGMYVEPKDATGRSLFPVQTGSYIAPIEVRHTGAAAAGVPRRAA